MGVKGRLVIRVFGFPSTGIPDLSNAAIATRNLSMPISPRRWASAPVAGPSARILAALIALAEFVTLGLRLGVTIRTDAVGPFDALWSMYRFFTVITNTAVGVVVVMVAMGVRPSAQVQAALLLAIGAVSIVYHLLLAVLVDFTGIEAVIDEMLHSVIPAVYALYWLLFAPKEGLSYRAVPLWLAYPLVYCGYALMRGEVDGIYPYPFLDVAAEGMISVSFNILGMLVAFWLAGLAIVAVGRLIRAAHIG